MPDANILFTIPISFCCFLELFCIYAFHKQYHFSFSQAKRVNKAFIPLRRKVNAVEPNDTWHWRLGLVVDNWLWGHEIPRLSPGCARSTLSPWKRIFTDISSHNVCVKRVPNCKKYARVTCHL